jgi:hypothetical protein
MPGLAVVFWLGERLLLICPVANPKTPALPKGKFFRFFHPISLGLSNLIGGSFDEKAHHSSV